MLWEITSKSSLKCSKDNIHSLSLTCSAGHLLTEDQVCQAGPALPKARPAGPDALVVLHVPHVALGMIGLLPFPALRSGWQACGSQEPPPGPSFSWAAHLLTATQLELPQLTRTAGKLWEVAWKAPSAPLDESCTDLCMSVCLVVGCW